MTDSFRLFSISSRRSSPALDSNHAATIDSILSSAALSAPERAQLHSISTETSPELYYSDLLQLAAGLEQRGASESAIACYRAVLAADSEEISTGLMSRAREGFDAISNHGTGGVRLEPMLRRIARESIDPAMLIGFGAARSAFALTRFAALSSFALRPGRSVVAGVLGASAAASFAGVVAEGAVFPLAMRLANTAFGRESHGANFGNELLSSYLTLGALRLVPSAGAWLRGNREPNAALASLEMLGGIYLAQRAEIGLGLRPDRDLAASFADSLVTLLQFHVAGRFAGHVLGEGFERWNGELIARADALRPPSRFGGWRLAGPRMDSGGLALAVVESRLRFGRPGTDENVAWMKGEGEGGSRRASSISGMSFFGESFPDVMRRITDPLTNFRDSIQAEHVLFQIRDPLPTDWKTDSAPILHYLNLLARSSRVTIPFGRRLVIHSIASNQRVIFHMTLSRGFEIVPPTREAAPVAPPESPTPALQPESKVPANGSGVRPAAKVSPPPFAQVTPNAGALPAVVRGSDRLAPAIQELSAMLARHRRAQGTLILEDAETSAAILNDRFTTGDPGFAGTLHLMVPRSKSFFVGQAVAGAIRWEREFSTAYSTAQGRAMFDNLVLNSPEELYLQIEAYSRDAGRAETAQSVFRYTGSIEPVAPLIDLIRQALNAYRLKGQSLTLEIPSLGQRLVFEGRHGRWREPNFAALEALNNTIKTGANPAPVRRDSPPEATVAALPRQRGALLRSNAIPIVYSGMISGFHSLLKRAFDDRVQSEGPRNIFLEPKHSDGEWMENFSVATLNAASELKSRAFPVGTEFQLFHLGLRKSYIGTVTQDLGLTWDLGNGNEWRIAAMRAIRNQPVKLHNPAELFLYLEALPNPTRKFSAEEVREYSERDITIHWDGPTPRTYQYDLKTFVTYSLFTHTPYGRSLTMRFQDASDPLEMENFQGDLWMEKAPPK